MWLNIENKSAFSSVQRKRISHTRPGKTNWGDLGWYLGWHCNLPKIGALL